MRVGLIDVDSSNFPNLPLMKISAWHKSQGDQVEWYDGAPVDRIYMSKVFSFTPDYCKELNAKEIFRGGLGIALKMLMEKRFTTLLKIFSFRMK